MDEDRRADSLTDSALDRQLQVALTVDPSPEFVARVRMRVTGEPVPSAWRWPWFVVAGGAAASVAAIAFVAVVTSGPGTIELDNRRLSIESADSRSVTERSVSADASARSAAEVRTTSDGRRVGARRREVASVIARPAAESEPRAFPEVLVSADEVRALQKLFAMFGARPNGETKLADLPSPPPLSPVELPEVEIAPLIIEPVPQLARLE